MFQRALLFHVSLNISLDYAEKQDFKSLDKKSQEIVMNYIQDNLPLNKKQITIKKNIFPQKMIFLCENCGFSENIKPGTNLFSKLSSNEVQQPNINYSYMIHSKILPITRNYICVNEKCESHIKNSKREAIFFRESNNSMKIIYICLACKSTF
jgi:hypothetical protein